MMRLKNLGIALATASLLNLAAAPVHWGPLALVALMPLMSLYELSWKQRLFWGWVAGLMTQAFAYFWIFLTIRDFGGLNSGLSFLGASLFWMYQGLDLALWLLLFPLLARGRLTPVMPLAAAVVWYLLQAQLFPYTFPWVYGSLFVEQPWLVGAAALWGDHGLTFWATLFQGFVFFGCRDKKRGLWALAALSLALMMMGHFFRPEKVEDAPVWRVAVIQPNLIPWAKRGQMSGQNIFLAHYEMTATLSRQDMDMVIWPETAIPFALNEAPYYQKKLRELAEALDVAVVTGAIERIDGDYLYNSVFLFPPDGGEIQIYRKQRLVMFSEQLPAPFGWMRNMVQGIGGFSAGEGTEVLEFRGRRIIPLVCFEALFSDYVRRFDGDLIINVTNDAWFGKTKASALHLQQIRTRAVEMGIPLVRATNSGISCWVDTDASVQGATGVYEEAGVIYDVPVPKHRYSLALKIGIRIINRGSWVILILLLGAQLYFKKKGTA